LEDRIRDGTGPKEYFGLGCLSWQDVKEDTVGISSIPLCLDPHDRRLKVFFLCCKSMSKRIERRFKGSKLWCKNGKGKEARRAGTREMPGIERQGEEGQWEVSFWRIAAVSVAPKGTEENSEVFCGHTGDPLCKLIPS
jgi:hypothetical protein